MQDYRISKRPRPKAANAAFIQPAVSCFDSPIEASNGLKPPDQFELSRAGSVGSGAVLDVEDSVVGAGGWAEVGTPTSEVESCASEVYVFDSSVSVAAVEVDDGRTVVKPRVSPLDVASMELMMNAAVELVLEVVGPY